MIEVIPPATSSVLDRSQLILDAFYRVPRASAELLSDGGGPFGFDIHAALAFDFLIEQFQCDGIVETGCCLGDTTEYLARVYPELPVWTCDIRADWAGFTRARVRRQPNVVVRHGSSAVLLSEPLSEMRRPILYLDAHWDSHWPLFDELKSIRAGVVVIDDFNIGNPRFAYDSYGGVECGPDVVRAAVGDTAGIFTLNENYIHSLPCLQVYRRSGRGILALELDDQAIIASTMFRLVTG